jgi:hypothetical protein
MQRLGETAEFGGLLLRLLQLNGWEIVGPDDGVTAFAGEGVLVIARRGEHEVRRTGPSVAAIAPVLFVEASRLQNTA